MCLSFSLSLDLLFLLLPTVSPAALLVANNERIFYIQVNENNYIASSLQSQPQLDFLDLSSSTATVKGNATFSFYNNSEIALFGYGVSIVVFHNEYNVNFISDIDYHYPRGEVYVSYSNDTIMRYSVSVNVTEDSSGDIELSVVSMATVQTGLPSGLTDITIDWINNDIYWTINGTTSFQVRF